MSSRNLGSLTIDLIAKVAGFEQGMDKAARTADRQMKKIEASAKKAGLAISAIGAGVATGIGIIVRNTMQAEKSLAQLDAILESTGQAAGFTRDQLVKMAQEFQKSSTFSTNEIIDAQTRLLSYSGILGENIPRAMQSVIDQATRLGMSVSQSAETIGRALESPAKAAAALAQQGFGAAFTAEVRATIDALVAAGREAEAQVMILEILEESYGGAAEAARNTLGGALTALRHTFTDLMTGGDGSLNGLTAAVNDLIDALNDPKVRQGFAELVNGALSVTTEFAKAIPKISEFTREFGTMVRQMGIDVGYLKEHVGASKDALAQIFSLGVADGTIKEAQARLDKAKQIRREMIAEDQRDLRRAKANAEARAGLANLNYVQYDGPLIAGFDLPTPPTPKPTPKPTGRSGGGRAGKSDEEIAAEQLQRAYDSLMASMHQRIALFDAEGEAARVRYEIEHGSLKGLDEIRQQALITETEQYDLMVKRRKEDEERSRAAQRETERIQEGLAYGKQVLADLQFELELMKMTNAERATAIQLRGMEAEAVAEYGEAIAQANRDIEESMKQVQLMDGFRREFANFFEDVIGGTKSVKDAFTDMLDNINRMILQRISENWVEQLFGNFGSSGGGSAGGNWFSAIASWFGGGKAGGGWASPYRMYEVNERGLEMATVNGRDFMLTGSKPVEITPNHQLGGGRTQNITQNFYTKRDRKSAAQQQQEASFRLRMASARG